MIRVHVHKEIPEGANGPVVRSIPEGADLSWWIPVEYVEVFMAAKPGDALAFELYDQKNGLKYIDLATDSVARLAVTAVVESVSP